MNVYILLDVLKHSSARDSSANILEQENGWRNVCYIKILYYKISGTEIFWRKFFRKFFRLNWFSTKISMPNRLPWCNLVQLRQWSQSNGFFSVFTHCWRMLQNFLEIKLPNGISRTLQWIRNQNCPSRKFCNIMF